MIKTDKGFVQLYKIYGRSETEIKEKLGDILNKNGNISVYTRTYANEVHVLAELVEQDEETAKKTLKAVAKEIKKALGTLVYS